MSKLRICDACTLPITEDDQAVEATLQGSPYDFHDSDRCWHRILAAITSAIDAAKADGA